jgi:hypothetical protein
MIRLFCSTLTTSFSPKGLGFCVHSLLSGHRHNARASPIIKAALPMNQRRVLIVSDHPLFAEGVVRLIHDQAGLQVVGVLAPDEALARIPSLGLDVVIVDVDRAAQPIFAQMLRESPGLKFIGLSLDNNDINVYYQRKTQSTGVEALVEAIKSVELGPKFQVLVITQGLYGQRIADHLRRRAPEHWAVQQWALPPVLPDWIEALHDLLPPVLSAADLILSLAQYPGVARLLPDIAKMTGAKGVIAPINNAAWLPVDQANQLRERLEQMGVASAFPHPFCTLTEMRYNVQGRQVELKDGPISEFARHFGRPAFKISIDANVLHTVEVLRDSPCGCARHVGENLPGIPVEQAEQRAETLYRDFSCLASVTVDSDYGDTLLNVSGHILQDALREQLEPFKAMPVSP